MLSPVGKRKPRTNDITPENWHASGQSRPRLGQKQTRERFPKFSVKLEIWQRKASHPLLSVLVLWQDHYLCVIPELEAEPLSITYLQTEGMAHLVEVEAAVGVMHPEEHLKDLHRLDLDLCERHRIPHLCERLRIPPLCEQLTILDQVGTPHLLQPLET